MWTPRLMRILPPTTCHEQWSVRNHSESKLMNHSIRSCHDAHKYIICWIFLTVQVVMQVCMCCLHCYYITWEINWGFERLRLCHRTNDICCLSPQFLILLLGRISSRRVISRAASIERHDHISCFSNPTNSLERAGTISYTESKKSITVAEFCGLAQMSRTKFANSIYLKFHQSTSYQQQVSHKRPIN